MFTIIDTQPKHKISIEKFSIQKTLQKINGNRSQAHVNNKVYLLGIHIYEYMMTNLVNVYHFLVSKPKIARSCFSIKFLVIRQSK
jgi:hypothetical protein